MKTITIDFDRYEEEKRAHRDKTIILGISIIVDKIKPVLELIDEDRKLEIIDILENEIKFWSK